LRETIEDIGATLLQVAGIKGEFKVNDFKLFEAQQTPPAV
jgi:hypothetical protein